jgi:beta-lactamase regulating signal transducer with metallopeptidase domain
VTLLTLFSAAAASALLSAIWQGAVLALCVALCLRLLPGISAAVRSFLWMAVFAIAFALHFIPAPHAATQIHAIHATPIWSLALAALWLALSLFRAAQFVLGAVRLRQVALRSTPIHELPRAPFIAPLSQAMSGSTPNSRPYTLCTSPDVDRPSVLGFFHPRILLPPGLVETLTPSELQQVLLHEIEHLRRSDDWTNLLQKLVLVVFPLNPVLLWVEHRLCLERELACDDRVLLSTGARKAYATCLTQLAEHSILHRGITLALGALGDRQRQSELSTRVHRILRRPEQLLSRTATRVVTATLLFGVSAASIALARSPRLISFAPTIPTSAVAQAENQDVQRRAPETWGSSATLVKAVMPASRPAPSTQRTPAPRKRTILRIQQTPRIIDTRWTAYQTQTRMTLTVSSGSQVQHFYVPAVAYVPAYAAVATPDGWIIIQL